MKMLLPRLLAICLQTDRYIPHITWSSESYVHNIFRVFELIFGRKVGIRREMTTDMSEDGTIIHVAHTFEASCALVESHIREFFKKPFPFKVYVPVLHTPQGIPVLASPYVFAIARDANSTATLGASPRTGNHTVSGSDRVMFLGSKGAAGYSTGATYNSVSMTRIADNTSGVGEYNLSLFYLIAPATGTNTVSVTVASGNIGWTAESYTGANQTTQPDVSNTGTAGAGSTSLTVSATTVTDNAWLVGYFSSSANTLTASTGMNFIIAQLNNVALGDSNAALTPAGSKSMRVTAGSGTFAGIVAGIRPTTSSTTIKTAGDLAIASVKTGGDLAKASIKTWGGLG